jgi:FixJ family two-component response regulator
LTGAHPRVAIVDDDLSVRESLPDWLKDFGFPSNAFASADEFLASGFVAQTGCLILDVVMPGMSGPDLQNELTLRGHKIPIIFITARFDRAVRKRVLDAGAAAYLLKPFSDTALLDAIRAALGTGASPP